MGGQSGNRPKRRATNTHIFRYLQTGNPSRLEEIDLRRALEASLEDWPNEDSVSCGQLSDQPSSNGCGSGTPTSLSSSSAPTTQLPSSTNPSSSSCRHRNHRSSSQSSSRCRNRKKQTTTTNSNGKSRQRRRSSSTKSFLQRNHLCHQHHHHNNNSNNNIHSCNQHCPNGHIANPHCCPLSSSVQSRYKPVAKKTIYHEADFFHEGIMEYIEYELLKSRCLQS